MLADVLRIDPDAPALRALDYAVIDSQATSPDLEGTAQTCWEHYILNSTRQESDPSAQGDNSFTYGIVPTTRQIGKGLIV